MNTRVYETLSIAITSELGYVEDGVYYADENCKDNLSSMVEFLDKDDKAGSCRQQLGAAGVFDSDLIPLLNHKVFIKGGFEGRDPWEV